MLERCGSTIHVSIPSSLTRKHGGIVVHRRQDLEPHLTTHQGIRVTMPALTVVDLAAAMPTPAVEAIINEADKTDAIDPRPFAAPSPRCLVSRASHRPAASSTAVRLC